MRKELEDIADYWTPKSKSHCGCGGEGCESCGWDILWDDAARDIAELVAEIRVLEGLLEEKT